jgi:hypothetical protein
VRLLAAVWAVALLATAVFVGRMAALPAKGDVTPAEVPVLVASSSPGVPPDPGRGPLPACWVVPHYLAPAGEPCPSAPAGSVRP